MNDTLLRLTHPHALPSSWFSSFVLLRFNISRPHSVHDRRDIMILCCHRDARRWIRFFSASNFETNILQGLSYSSSYIISTAKQLMKWNDDTSRADVEHRRQTWRFVTRYTLRIERAVDVTPAKLKFKISDILLFFFLSFSLFLPPSCICLWTFITTTTTNFDIEKKNHLLMLNLY